MYQERSDIYRHLESNRGSKLLVYVTGDRRGLETQIHPEVLGYMVNHLDAIGSTSRISLLLYTRGGDIIAAWSIVNLIRQYCDTFEVIIPDKAHSAGTMIALGADEIIMTKQATLGPIDPSVNTPLNPEVSGASGNARMPVSVEAINGYIELAKETGITGSEELASIMSALSAHVHPLVLGQVYRSRGQIKMLGRRLLSKHMQNNGAIEKGAIEKIVSFLCSESGSHDYTIYRQEARDELHLNVSSPDDKLYPLIKQIYDNITDELQLQEPYDSHVLRAGQSVYNYELSRALVESVAGGSHRFVSKGILTPRQIVVDPNTNTIHEATQDIRTSERWSHEHIQG